MKQEETFWDKRSRQYDAAVTKRDANYINIIDSTIALLSSKDVVLDFACASGEYSLDLAPCVQRVHGIDLSTRMIELANKKARERQIANVTFDSADVFDASLNRGAYSAIVAFNILHLVNDLPGVLARLHELLKTDGVLISLTPCLGEKSWLFRHMVGLAHKLGAVPSISTLTSSSLASLVAGNGFEITENRTWNKKHRAQWIVAHKLR